MHIVFVQNSGFSKFVCQILAINIDLPIGCMLAVRYIGTLRLAPTYLQHQAIRSMCPSLIKIAVKLRDKSSLQQTDTRRLGQTDRASLTPLLTAIQNIYFIKCWRCLLVKVCCKLLNKINIYSREGYNDCCVSQT